MSSNDEMMESKTITRKIVRADGVHLPKKPAHYLIINEETGNSYVGSTKNAAMRINHHMSDLKSGTHSNTRLQAEFDQAKNKDRIVVHVTPAPDVETARDEEQKVLDRFHGSSALLNVSDNARAPSSGYDRTAVVAKMKETKNTPEYKARVSEKSKAMWETPGYRERHIADVGEAVVIDGKKYNSVREASRECGVAIATIRSRMNNGNEVTLADMRKPSRKVSANGVIYDTVTLAANACSIACNTMTHRCQSNNPSMKDFFYV